MRPVSSPAMSTIACAAFWKKSDEVAALWKTLIEVFSQPSIALCCSSADPSCGPG